MLSGCYVAEDCILVLINQLTKAATTIPINQEQQQQ